MYHSNVNVSLIVKHVTQIKNVVLRNAGASLKIQKEHNPCEKKNWNPAMCSCESDKYI